MVYKAAVAMALCATADGLRRQRKSEQSTCGIAGQSLSSGPNMSIVNGEDAPECAWKWQVGLKSSRTGRPWCGGMLVSPEWVLTAAHCLAGEPQNGIWVVAGEWNVRTTSGNEQTVQSASWVDHPQYDRSTTDHDFGLIRLSSPMEMNGCVGTVCLPEADVAPGSTCWITGWGTLSSGGSSPDILQEAAVGVLSNQDCKNTNYASSQITDSMLCAQGRNSNGITDACQGDSGGPLVCESSGIWTVYGATSWGSGCAGENYPGIWARIHYVIDWINSYVYTGPPTPAPPTPPPPPPGTWVVTGSGCEESGSCVQSNNHPGNYGNNQQCTIELWEVSLTVEAFNTESSYDTLTVEGNQYSGTNGPASGSYSGAISWTSDYSVTKSGWRLCRS